MKITCPKCGTKFAADAGAGDSVVECTQCGTRLKVKKKAASASTPAVRQTLPEPQPAYEPSPGPYAGQEDAADWGTEPAYDAPVGTNGEDYASPADEPPAYDEAAEDAPPARPVAAGAVAHSAAEPAGGSGKRVGLLAGVGAAVLAAAVGGYFFFRADPWESANRDHLVALSVELRSAVEAGKIGVASQKYQELEGLVAGHEIHDAALKQRVDEAREQGRIAQSNAADAPAAPARPDPFAATGKGTSATPAARDDAPAATAASAHVPPWEAKAAVGPAATAATAAPQTTPTPAVVTTPPAATAPVVAVAPVVAPPAADPVPATVPTAPVAEVPKDPPAATKPAAATAVAPRVALKIAPVPPAARADDLTDEQVGVAIEKAARYLMGQFKNGQLTNATAGQASGEDILAVYALLQAGLSSNIGELDIRNKFMADCVTAMKNLPVEASRETYERGIRATALALLNRPEDKAVLADDVEHLVLRSNFGGYTYTLSTTPMPVRGPGNVNPGQYTYDNSNSQYGALGAWSAAEVGIEIPLWYWQLVERHWFYSQCPNGQWPYSGPLANAPVVAAPKVIPPGGIRGAQGNQPPPPVAAAPAGTLPMTLAGLASSFVTYDYLYVAQFGKDVGRDPFSPPVLAGLKWLEDGNNSAGVWAYSAYGLERVGLASGFKYFGSHDWYREYALKLVGMQAGRANGSLGDTIVDHCYNLLFLARGRHPVIMNKLRFEHFWDNRPRDLYGLARYSGPELENVFNWQIIRADRDWVDWTDSPIVYLASHEVPKLKPAELDALADKLRAFSQAGGLIFTQADGASATFTKFITDPKTGLAKKIFPDYEIEKLPADHEIFKVFAKVARPPQLVGVSNGSRLLMVHSPTDLSMFWQQRTTKSNPVPFQVGLNLYVYAAGKSDYPNRLTRTLPEPVANNATPGGVVKVARVKYAGNWNPEPFAWERFDRELQRQTSVKLDVAAVDMAKLTEAPPAQRPLVAHLTGTFLYTPSEAECNALRQYVQDGGVLLIDACGGGAFNDVWIKSILPQVFPDARPTRVPTSHPLLNGSIAGSDALPKAQVRPYVLSKQAAAQAGRFETFSYGKGQVIYSALDLTSGLAGVKAWGILGYSPKYCTSFVKDLVLWTAAGSPQ